MLRIYNSSWNRSPKNHQQIGGFSDLYSLFQHNVDSTENSLLLQSFRWRFLQSRKRTGLSSKKWSSTYQESLVDSEWSGRVSIITLDPSSPHKEIWHQLTSYISAVTVFLLLNFRPSAFPMLRPLRPPTQETRLRKLKKPSTVFPVNTPSCRRICLFFLWKNKTGF